MHPDGSFSPFGRTDSSGSVWLTALVAATLPAVGQYITVDPVLAEQALFWLVDGQERDGAFRERGVITHRMQENPVSLTAYTVLGFLEHRRNLTAPLRNSMNRALDYLASRWPELDDPYDLAVLTYARPVLSQASSQVLPLAPCTRVDLSNMLGMVASMSFLTR